ncbi:MAG: hypothetical protein J6D03_07250 [Clostridia bacterium]|nr:hypothetical protein [Clostridia bacterium]
MNNNIFTEAQLQMAKEKFNGVIDVTFTKYGNIKLKNNNDKSGIYFTLYFYKGRYIVRVSNPNGGTHQYKLNVKRKYTTYNCGGHEYKYSVQDHENSGSNTFEDLLKYMKYYFIKYRKYNFEP